MTDYVFEWDKMLSFQGNTAPYLQNAYVRIRSIFRKLDGEFDAPEIPTLEAAEERALAIKLLQFGEIVPLVLEDFRPNLLANYLYDLAIAFHAFYEACPVLKADGAERRSSRLVLCDVTGSRAQHRVSVCSESNAPRGCETLRTSYRMGMMSRKISRNPKSFRVAHHQGKDGVNPWLNSHRKISQSRL